jgi:GT2 family glycosyltransferase
MRGLAIITHGRPEYFNQCLESVKKNDRDLDHLIVVCSNDEGYTFPPDLEVILNNTDRKWVAVNKNLALKELLNKGCDHLFLLEDDVLINSPDVFVRYEEAASKAGFQHLNFALHGSANAGGYKFTDNNVDYYPECVGAFSYFTREVIEKCGMFDEHFKNAWEHCQLTQRIGDKGYTSPFWAFADTHGSGELLKEIPGSIKNSSIRPNKDWETNIKEGLLYWQSIDPNCPIEAYR